MKTVISSDFLSGPGFALGKAADRNTALRKVNTATAAAVIMCVFVLTSQICCLSNNHAALVSVVISRLKTEPSIICITSNDTTTAPVSGAFFCINRRKSSFHSVSLISACWLSFNLAAKSCLVLWVWHLAVLGASHQVSLNHTQQYRHGLFCSPTSRFSLFRVFFYPQVP